MALLDDMKTVLRLSTDALDSEVSMLVDAALADLERLGICEDLIDADDPDPRVRMAVALYCKAHFGYDNDEAERFDTSYRRVAADLLNSAANSAYYPEESE